METYSVSTNNRFALFVDEEDDPGDLILPGEGKERAEKGDKDKKRTDAKPGKASKAREAKDKGQPALGKKQPPAEATNKRECRVACVHWRETRRCARLYRRVRGG